jgi:subtilisin family serine protease
MVTSANAKNPATNQTVLLHLNNHSYDPSQSQPKSSAIFASAVKTKQAQQYFIIQFNGPIKQQDHNMMASMQIRIYDYIPNFAFIVQMPKSLSQKVINNPRVRWIGPYRPELKISPRLSARVATVSPHVSTQQKINLRINLFPDVNPKDVRKTLSGFATITKSYQTKWQTSFQIETDLKKIPELAQIQGIKWISTMPRWQLLNNVASGIVHVSQVRNRFALYGEGQIVGVCDTGLDQGKKKPESLHDDFEDGNGLSRVNELFNLTQSYFNDTPDDIFSGHGTHVAGTIMGNGFMSGSHPSMNYFPQSSYAGIAPKARLVFQAAEDSNTGMLLGLILDLNKIFEQAYFADARIHSNSWGAASASTYSSESADVDQYMWENKDFLIVFAAGNSGVDMDHDGRIDPFSICSPASSKNCLTVGGSENVRPDEGYTCAYGECWSRLYAKDPIASDHLANNQNGMAAFSSRGPTLDGRFKPDIVAPATNIISARSSKASMNGWGVCSNNNYLYMGGTSMATPIVAGTAVLMREYLEKIGIVNPPSALIKAALLNAANSMGTGQYGNDQYQEIPDICPNNVNGWGLLNLENGVYPTSPLSFIYKYDAQLNTDETVTYYFENLDSQYPIKINLVWTDYPGSPMSQGGLVNDLDLHVVGPDDQIHYPDNAMNQSVVQSIQYDYGFPMFISDKPICGMRFSLENKPAFLDAVSISLANADAVQDDIWIRVYDISDKNKLPETLRYEKKYRFLPSGWTTLPMNHIEFQCEEFLVAIEKNSPDIQVSTDIFSDSNRGMTKNGSQWVTSGEAYYIRAHVRQQNHSTDYDRVNNSVSIHLRNPQRGGYQIDISGYNVPYGPQPFALVAQGAIRESPPQKSFSIHMPQTLKEGDGKLIQAGMVSIQQALDNDLFIYLSSSDFTEIIVPQHVILPSGQNHVRFDIQVVDDPAEDGRQTVIIEARAQNYFPASISVTVEDNDSKPVLHVSPDHIIVPYIAGIAEFMVSNAGTGQMQWIASVNSDWLSIQEGHEGIDTGMIKVAYQVNEGHIRMGHLSVRIKNVPDAVQTIEIHQKSEKIETRLSPSDGYRYDYFGYSTDICKYHAAIGAYKHDGNKSDSGAVYIYAYKDLNWQMTQKLVAHDSERRNYFGASVSIHDIQLAVGAYNVDNKESSAGATYVFEKNNDQWIETAKLFASDGSKSDYFGHSVGIYNDKMVVGAYKADSFGSDSGAAYVFEKQNDSWRETCKLLPDNLDSYDYYGYSTAISENIIIVGAYGDDTRGTCAGAAYIFEKKGNQWKFMHRLIPDAAKINDYAGFSVDISDKYAVMGAYNVDIKGSNTGAAYVFEKKNDMWIEIKSLYPWSAKGYDYFGASVAIAGNYVIVGAYGDASKGRLAGGAYVFQLVEGVWKDCVYISASDGHPGDRFGASVSISDTGDALIGAYGQDIKGSQSGAAYIYSVFTMASGNNLEITDHAFGRDTHLQHKSNRTENLERIQVNGNFSHMPSVVNSVLPKRSAVIHYDIIPELGNRVKNLKGHITEVLTGISSLYITAYLYINNQWHFKESVPVDENGFFELDITKLPGDHLAGKIAVFVHSDSFSHGMPQIIEKLLEKWTEKALISNIILRNE